MMHTLEFTIFGEWHLHPACGWMSKWIDQTGERGERRYFYRGVLYLVDNGGDRIALAVKGMDESDLMLFKMRFDATIKQGDIYWGQYP